MLSNSFCTYTVFKRFLTSHLFENKNEQLSSESPYSTKPSNHVRYTICETFPLLLLCNQRLSLLKMFLRTHIPIWLFQQKSKDMYCMQILIKRNCRNLWHTISQFFLRSPTLHSISTTAYFIICPFFLLLSDTVPLWDLVYSALGVGNIVSQNPSILSTGHIFCTCPPHSPSIQPINLQMPSLPAVFLW